jgi:hypothetical protein
MQMTESQVRSISLPSDIKPTRMWRPLPHSLVLDEIDRALDRAHLSIDRDECNESRRTFTVNEHGAKLFATMPLTSHVDKHARLMLGLINSFNRSLALRVGFGAEVFLCSNGSFCAEKIVGRKHTMHIMEDLPVLLDEALAQVPLYRDQQRSFFKALRGAEISDRDATWMVVEAARKVDAITSGEIVHVVNEWYEPTYEEFGSKKSAWRLYNAFTQVGKRIQVRNGVSHAERSTRLTRYFTEQFAPTINFSPVI